MEKRRRKDSAIPLPGKKNKERRIHSKEVAGKRQQHLLQDNSMKKGMVHPKALLLMYHVYVNQFCCSVLFCFFASHVIQFWFARTDMYVDMWIDYFVH